MGSINNFLFFILTLAILARELVGERDFVIYVDYVSCNHNPQYIKSSNCSVDKMFNPPRVNVDLQLQRTIASAFISVKLTIQQNKSVRTYLNIKNQNGCDFLDGKNLKKIVLIVRSFARQFAQIPKRCPVEKVKPELTAPLGLEDYRFLFKDLVVDANYLPTFTPDANFTIRTILRTGKDFGFSFESKGFIRRK